jgi:hypothetical protein
MRNQHTLARSPIFLPSGVDFRANASVCPSSRAKNERESGGNAEQLEIDAYGP